VKVAVQSAQASSPKLLSKKIAGANIICLPSLIGA